VTCDDARLLIGADPEASNAALEAHLQGCPVCRELQAQMRAQNALIRRALAQPPPLAQAPPVAAPVVPLVRRRRTPWRPVALAASVLLALTVVAGAWLLRPSATLAHEVALHVAAEPESWFAKEHVSAAAINDALRGAGVELNVSSDQIMYAQSCWFRGHYVPHLVLQTASGPATVLLLRHEHVHMRHRFSEDGMSGMIVPSGDGSIAVLTKGGDAARIAGQMQQDVRWLPQGS
jgi:Protein of unknown function (DUF3379)